MSDREKVLAATGSWLVSSADGPEMRQLGFNAILALRAIIEAHVIENTNVGEHGGWKCAGCDWKKQVMYYSDRRPSACPNGERAVTIAASILFPKGVK